MRDWENGLGVARADFTDSLERLGLERVADGWEGAVLVDTQPLRFHVVLGDGFPFAPPKVRPTDDLPMSWHRERNGSMCLYTQEDRAGLPWLEVPDFLAHIQIWFERTAAGWIDDAPDLDLEQYFEPADPSPLVLYDDISAWIGQYVRLRVQPNTLQVIGIGTAPKKHRRRNHRFGYVVTIGQPSEPPRNWDEIASHVPSGERVTRAIRDRKIDVVLVHYTRAGRDGVLALDVRPARDGGVLTRAYPTASTSTTVAQLRAGPMRSILATKHVYLVGAGALGSFLADSLVRAGIGHLTIRDFDVLRPGNLTRHLADDSEIGLRKAQAVKVRLRDQHYNHTEISVDITPLTSATEAEEVIASCDLVIDATADGSVTAMLHHVALATGNRVISACLQNDGDTFRVDLIPPLNGDPLPKTLLRQQGGDLAFEGGCGDPVSPTPPYAVLEAAAMATRHAVGLLCGQPVSPAGEVREYPAHDPTQP